MSSSSSTPPPIRLARSTISTRVWGRASTSTAAPAVTHSRPSAARAPTRTRRLRWQPRTAPQQGAGVHYADRSRARGALQVRRRRARPVRDNWPNRCAARLRHHAARFRHCRPDRRSHLPHTNADLWRRADRGHSRSHHSREPVCLRRRQVGAGDFGSTQPTATMARSPASGGKRRTSRCRSSLARPTTSSRASPTSSSRPNAKRTPRARRTGCPKTTPTLMPRRKAKCHPMRCSSRFSCAFLRLRNRTSI